MSFSARLDAALSLAARAHRKQVRKGTDIPYIVHPVHVAMILLAHGFSEEIAIAGLLHDTLEDCDLPVDEVRAAFGEDVSEMVVAVTEVKKEGGQTRPWRVRKEEQLAHLAAASRDVAALKAADALHNASCTVAELRTHGGTVWGRFNAGPDDTIWYYQEVARLCGERLGDHPLARELLATVETLAALR